jgi:membrane-bound ClpP family serine protease
MPSLSALPLLAVAALVMMPFPATVAQQPTTVVDVVKMEGLIDPALDDFVRGAIGGAERAGTVVVLQIDSRGGYGERGARLGEFIR